MLAKFDGNHALHNRCCPCSRNIGSTAPKFGYFYYKKIYFLDQSIQKNGLFGFKNRSTVYNVSCASLQTAFEPEVHLLQQVKLVKAQIQESLGQSMFAGISIVTTELLGRLPTKRREIEEPGFIQELGVLIRSLHHLTRATAMTVSDAMAFRSEHVSEILQQMQVDVSSQAGGYYTSTQPGIAFPDWVLNVEVSDQCFQTVIF